MWKELKWLFVISSYSEMKLTHVDTTNKPSSAQTTTAVGNLLSFSCSQIFGGIQSFCRDISTFSTMIHHWFATNLTNPFDIARLSL